MWEKPTELCLSFRQVMFLTQGSYEGKRKRARKEKGNAFRKVFTALLKYARGDAVHCRRIPMCSSTLFHGSAMHRAGVGRLVIRSLRSMLESPICLVWVGWGPGVYFQKLPRWFWCSPRFWNHFGEKMTAIGSSGHRNTPFVGYVAISMTWHKVAGLPGFLARGWMRPQDHFVHGFEIRGDFKPPTASLLPIAWDEGVRPCVWGAHGRLGNTDSPSLLDPPGAQTCMYLMVRCLRRHQFPVVWWPWVPKLCHSLHRLQAAATHTARNSPSCMFSIPLSQAVNYFFFPLRVLDFPQQVPVHLDAPKTIPQLAQAVCTRLCDASCSV